MCSLCLCVELAMLLLADFKSCVALNMRLNVDALVELYAAFWAFATGNVGRWVNHNVAAINSLHTGYGDFDALKFRRARSAIGQAFESRYFAFGRCALCDDRLTIDNDGVGNAELQNIADFNII